MRHCAAEQLCCWRCRAAVLLARILVRSGRSTILVLHANFCRHLNWMCLHSRRRKRQQWRPCRNSLATSRLPMRRCRLSNRACFPSHLVLHLPSPLSLSRARSLSFSLSLSLSRSLSLALSRSLSLSLARSLSLPSSVHIFINHAHTHRQHKAACTNARTAPRDTPTSWPFSWCHVCACVCVCVCARTCGCIAECARKACVCHVTVTVCVMSR